MIKKKNKKREKRLFEIDKGAGSELYLYLIEKKKKKKKNPKNCKSYETNVPMSLRDCPLPTSKSNYITKLGNLLIKIYFCVWRLLIVKKYWRTLQVQLLKRNN